MKFPFPSFVFSANKQHYTKAFGMIHHVLSNQQLTLLTIDYLNNQIIVKALGRGADKVLYILDLKIN